MIPASVFCPRSDLPQAYTSVYTLLVLCLFCCRIIGKSTFSALQIRIGHLRRWAFSQFDPFFRLKRRPNRPYGYRPSTPPPKRPSQENAAIFPFVATTVAQLGPHLIKLSTFCPQSILVNPFCALLIVMDKRPDCTSIS
jgi:hypothetical protein